MHITRKNANFFKAYTNAAGEGAVLTPEKATMVAEAASAQSQVNLAPVIVNAASNTAHVVQAGAAANAMGAGAGVHPELLAQLASHMLVQGPGGYFHTQAAAAPASQHIQNNITGLLTQLAAEGPSHLPPHLQQQYQLLMQRGRPDPTAGLSADGSGSGPMTGNFFPHQIQSAPAMPSLGLGGFSSNLCGPMSAPANPMMFGMFSGGLQQQMQLQQSGMPLLQMPFLPMPMQMQMNTPPFMTGMQGQGQGQLFASMMGPPPMQGAHEYPGLLVSPAVLGQASESIACSCSVHTRVRRRLSMIANSPRGSVLSFVGSFRCFPQKRPQASAQRPPNPSGDATQQ